MAKSDKRAVDGDVETPVQPGVVITPGSSPPQINEPKVTATEPLQVADSVSPAEITSLPSTSISDSEGISWTASEFVAHEKSSGWYISLAIGAIVIFAFIYLLTKDIISASAVLVGALVLGIYGARKPRQLGYNLDGNGVTIGSRYHSYQEFRSFSVLPEGHFSSVVFMPLKRFAPLRTIYYAPEDEEKIIKLLSDELPFEERSHDVVDRLMRRIRF